MIKHFVQNLQLNDIFTWISLKHSINVANHTKRWFYQSKMYVLSKDFLYTVNNCSENISKVKNAFSINKSSCGNASIFAVDSLIENEYFHWAHNLTQSFTLHSKLHKYLGDLNESERKNKMFSGTVYRFCNFYSDIFVPTDKKEYYCLESENNCS